jgi:hypothetical protein
MFFSQYCIFLLYMLFHQCPILTFVYMLLVPEEPAGEDCEHLKSNVLSEIGEKRIEECFHFRSLKLRRGRAMGQAFGRRSSNVEARARS